MTAARSHARAIPSDRSRCAAGRTSAGARWFALACGLVAACGSSEAPSSEVSAAGQAGSTAPAASGGAGGARIVTGDRAGAAAGQGAAGFAEPSAGRAAAAGAPAAQSGGGGAQAAGAAAGAGGMPSTASSSVQPIERSGKYAFEFDDIVFEVDPSVGARIQRYEIAGQNVLTGPEVDATNWGATFWPSPQQRWDWPPVPELDSQAYTGGIQGDAIVLTSALGERAKVQVEKRFTADAAERAIDIDYTLTNTDTAAASWAGWEITRVAANGLTFFPTGMSAVNTQLAVTNRDDISWYAHDPSALSMGGQKFSADGSGGWLAHVAGRTLLVKQFVDVPPAMQAPAPEAEIELYAAATYVELEPQGPYTELAPGASLRWSVRWLAQPLDSNVQVMLGNPALVELAEALLKSTP